MLDSAYGLVFSNIVPGLYYCLHLKVYQITSAQSTKKSIEQVFEKVPEFGPPKAGPTWSGIE